MAICDFCDSCSFFKEEFKGIPHIKNLLCKAFCNSHFTTCARYKIAVSKGIGHVPHELLPDGLREYGTFVERDVR
jgi:hypothetical protein